MFVYLNSILIQSFSELSFSVSFEVEICVVSVPDSSSGMSLKVGLSYSSKYRNILFLISHLNLFLFSYILRWVFIAFIAFFINFFSNNLVRWFRFKNSSGIWWHDISSFSSEIPDITNYSWLLFTMCKYNFVAILLSSFLHIWKAQNVI